MAFLKRFALAFLGMCGFIAILALMGAIVFGIYTYLTFEIMRLSANYIIAIGFMLLITLFALAIALAE